MEITGTKHIPAAKIHLLSCLSPAVCFHMMNAKAKTVAGARKDDVGESSAVLAERQESVGDDTAGMGGCRVERAREERRWLVENWQAASDTVKAAQMRL